MRGLYSEQRLRSLGNFGIGVGLILLGIALAEAPVLLLAPLVVSLGVYLAAIGAAQWLRVQARVRALAQEFGPELELRHARAPVSHQVFWLLFAVAEADGRATPEERMLVERFIVSRFPELALLAPLDRLELSTFPRDRVGALALRLRDRLTFMEAQTLFWWACQIAFIDVSFTEPEHDVLQQIARGLGIPGVQARAIFHHARLRALAGRSTGGAHEAPPRPRPLDERTRALAVLGLPPDATETDIRKRHRELVRKFHPDAHQHLGPVAAAEATERFREIQAAYERLTQAR